MAPPTLVPDKNTLQRWLKEGLTHQEMADRVYEETGNKITRNAISNAMSKYGLAKDLPRYSDTIPWRCKVGHAKAYQLRMLRLLGRRNQGGKLNKTEKAALESWLERMASENVIVAYDPEDDRGFFYIDAKFKDHKEDIPIRKKTIHLSLIHI